MGRAKIKAPATLFLPCQAKWIKDRSRMKIAEKARQIGFTWCSSYADMTGTARANNHIDTWITSRDALQAKGIKPCIPGRKSRNKAVKYDKRRYRRRNRIEIMFGRLKDWRRVATRYDRCPTAFFSAIALAATVIFWL